MFYGYDPTYILVIIGAILSMIASSFVQSTYSKYSRVQSRTGMTGAQAAQRILQMSGISDVRIEHVSGKLTDHYDPSQKVVRLSDSVYGSTSVAAIGVAAHECGHVVQHHKGYLPMKIRTLLVPAANLGSKLGIPIVLLGLILGLNFHLPDGTYFSLAQIGVYIFTFAFKEGGKVTAGNASGINDGAAAIIVMSEEKAKELGVTPMATWIGGELAGVEPRIMGIGPVASTRKVMEKKGYKIEDFDLIEANEAFAAQSVAVGHDLGFDMDKLNVNGSAIALGHPVGASGCRILVTLLYEMQRRHAKKGLATLCVGGGMGCSAIVEMDN